VFDVDLNRRRGQDADVHDVAPGRQQTAIDGVLQHRPAQPRIAAHHHAAPAHVGAERLREVQRQRRSEELRNHAAHARYTDLQQMFAGH
jgi:hypothetical protein